MALWGARPAGTGTYGVGDESARAHGEVLALRDVSKEYRERGKPPLLVLDGVTLRAGSGEFVALVGPSGAGKSTLLSIVAGLEAPTRGEVALEGDLHAPRLGHVGYMPQKDLLLPWRDALDNAIAGLQVRGVPTARARQMARELFARFGLAGFERSYPQALSGGMRQRVAFARAVLASGHLLLLDEPFGALDALTRTAMQRWLLDLWSELEKTCLLVTHDVDEAMLLADRVVLLSARPGRVRMERTVPLERPRRIEQLARPEVASLKAELLAALMAEVGSGPPGDDAASGRERGV